MAGLVPRGSLTYMATLSSALPGSGLQVSPGEHLPCPAPRMPRLLCCVEPVYRAEWLPCARLARSHLLIATVLQVDMGGTFLVQGRKQVQKGPVTYAQGHESNNY